jgi:hypothetical protein
MPIDVTCAKCHTRFQVSEKYAGKKGPCPKCKTIITVPTLEEQVVVHAPEMSGPKDSKGQSVLKPIARTETKLSRPMIIGIVVSIGLVLLLALILRVGFPGGTIWQKAPLIVMVGAVLLAPPLSYAAYHFLRNDELAPFTLRELLLRLIAPSVVYPAIWGLYWFVISYLDLSPDAFLLAFAVPIVVVIGAFTAQASLDLEFGAAAFHYTTYLTVTILLRVILGMSAYWHDPGATKKPTKPTPKKVAQVVVSASHVTWELQKPALRCCKGSRTALITF